jgi:uncharacterized protein (DUF433 family)
MDWHGYIQRDPAIMLGKPVVRGTRITVELILERLGDGWSETQVLESFPSLKAEHIRAAQSYAAAAISSDEIVILDGRSN